MKVVRSNRWLAYLAAFGPLALGLVADIWTESIASASFPTSLPPAHINWRGTIFWVLLLLSPLVIAFTIRDSHAAEERADSSASSIRLQLEKVLQMVPASAQMFAKVDGMATSYERHDKRAALRFLLQGFAHLAWAYDGKPTARYAANIMFYVPIDSVTPAQLNGVLFLEHPREQLQGILELHSVVSTALDVSRVAVDDKLVSFALPVPLKEYSRAGNLQRVLPGAPRAFLQESDGYGSIDDVLEWCENETDFTDAVRTAIRDYFESTAGRQVQSFYCVALRVPSRSMPVGVLNLHSDKPGILAKDVNDFQAISLVFQERMAEIVANSDWKTHL